MPGFRVRVTMENRPEISDPEGATILDDLVLRGDHAGVSRIRTAKTLWFYLESADGEGAREKVQRICDDLRIYNPLVSTLSLEVSPDPDAGDGGLRPDSN